MKLPQVMDTNFFMSLSKTAAPAAWERPSHITDPLADDETSPHAAVPHWQNRGKNIGEAAGRSFGSIAGLAAPALVGGGIGALAGHALGHFIGADSLTLPVAGGLTGAALAAPLGVASAPVGAGIGSIAGKSVGGFAGRKLEETYSPERQSAEKIRRLPPQQGYALIRTLERTGHSSPEELQAMKDAYEARRQGFQDQVRAGVMG